MLTSHPTFEKMLLELFACLEEIESREADFNKRLDSCIKACEKSLQQLRQWVAEHAFPDSAAEICFFKCVKPAVLSKLIYYQRLFRLHNSPCHVCGQFQKEELMRMAQGLYQFLLDNHVFYEYQVNDSDHLDEWYFLREKYDWKVCACGYNCDPLFATNADIMMAEVLANKLLLEYVNAMLNPLTTPVHNTGRIPSSSALHPTAPVTYIVELGYSLYTSGFFGKATLKDIMKFLSEALQVDLQQFYRIFLHIKARKKQPTKFLDELKTSLLRYMDQAGDQSSDI